MLCRQVVPLLLMKVKFIRKEQLFRTVLYLARNAKHTLFISL